MLEHLEKVLWQMKLLNDTYSFALIVLNLLNHSLPQFERLSEWPIESRILGPIYTMDIISISV